MTPQELKQIRGTRPQRVMAAELCIGLRHYQKLEAGHAAITKGIEKLAKISREKKHKK